MGGTQKAIGDKLRLIGQMKNNQQTMKEVIIDWTYPEPKTGIDKFFGPGATTAELVIQQIFPYSFGIIILLLGLFGDWDWAWYQAIVAALLATDMLGGVITNATSSAKRWYHREGQDFMEHVKFTSIHIAQILLVVVFFDRWNWLFLFGSFGYLMVAAICILASPLYLHRPIAMSFLAGGLVLSLYVFKAPTHLEWFLPLLYVKLLVSHLLREEPYRPVEERRKIQ